MDIHLAANNYGKSRVRLVKVSRRGARHELKDISVDIQFEGDFESAHIAGDNSRILPTDTMKNTVYAMARQSQAGPIEEFGLALATHFLSGNAQVSQARIEITERLWNRIAADGTPQDHAFVSAGAESRTARIVATRKTTAVEAGIHSLLVLKTAGSAFA